MKTAAFALAVVAVLAPVAFAAQGANLIADPSFEETKPADQFGLVFAKWGGWKYEGDCEFKVGEVAHSGRHSACLFGANAPKIRIRAGKTKYEPGRYRITAYIRGLDIGAGAWNRATEFEFGGNFMDLKKNGTFGWTPLAYVVEVPEAAEIESPSFGLWAPGYFWIDDVAVEKVGNAVALTAQPVLGAEESPVGPPSLLDEKTAVRCVECGYRNNFAWGKCYACGTMLVASASTGRQAGPSTRVIASFEDRSPFSPGEVVAEHATEGHKSLRLAGGYTSMDAPQDWTGFDYLKADVFNAADSAQRLTVEIRDTSTRDYWTRVNFETVVPPGASTFVLPTNIYVGEKSRPGRQLDRAHVTRLVFGIDEKAPAPVYIDNVRVERDDSAAKARFEGLYAFDFGTDSSPLMDGFTKLTPATLYSKGRGYGLKDAQVWRAMDVLQPEPLYQDFICITSGGLAVDVPNGKYHVFANIDHPSMYWGEFQRYRERAILAEGRPVVSEKMDFDAFQKKYYRFWQVEDTPAENTFDKYQEPYYDEKEFDVEVADGQINIDFRGEADACSVSCVVIYPAAQADAGRAFLDFARDKRRFHFDNYFKRVLHDPANPSFAASADDEKRGFSVFSRGFMSDVFYNDRPAAGEVCAGLSASAFAGEYEPVTFSIVPLRDLGKASVSVADLKSDAGVIPSSAVDVGFVSYRLSRVTMEGSVYAIAPTLIMPFASVEMPRDVTRTWWLTVKVPGDAPAGLYRGDVTFASADGSSVALPLELTVRPGALDALDVPAGPWGHTIDTNWYGDDAAASEWNDAMARKSLARIRDYGFTSFSGAPSVSYGGFRDDKPVLNFSAGDAQMKRAKEAGFTMPITNYTQFGGLDLYYIDEAAMKAAGFKDYSLFIRAVFSAVQKHAEEAGWLPVYWNLCDEPIGDNLTRAIANARAYRQAFPDGPPFFSGATSVTSNDPADPHLQLAQALHVANVNLHSEDAIALIHKAGSDWAFYNGGNRWTFGGYMYKAVKEFGMKFRHSWHWNNVSGDPYYALDGREDDYAWCNSAPDGTLIPSLDFERLREGVDDYRMILTLARLAKEKKGTPEAAAADKLLSERLASFKLGQRDHDALFGAADWNEWRTKVSDAIAALRR